MATQDETAAVRVIGAAVRFGDVVALDHVTLTVAPGEVRGIIGPNGAGKTTMIDVIAGHQTAGPGRVELGGADVTAATEADRRAAGVRRTYQWPRVAPALTVAENLVSEAAHNDRGFLRDLVGRTARAAVERRRREHLKDVLAACGLTDLRNALAGSLPSGTTRMVELGRAIIDQPSVLLLDEPTASVDPADVQRVIAIIQGITRRRGAVVVVDHEVGFVSAHCDRVLVLDAGRVVADGAAAEVFADPAVRAVYLD